MRIPCFWVLGGPLGVCLTSSSYCLDRPSPCLLWKCICELEKLTNVFQWVKSRDFKWFDVLLHPALSSAIKAMDDGLYCRTWHRFINVKFIRLQSFWYLERGFSGSFYSRIFLSISDHILINFHFAIRFRCDLSSSHLFAQPMLQLKDGIIKTLFKIWYINLQSRHGNIVLK